MSNKELLISTIGAFIAVITAGFFSNVILQSTNSPLIIASAGASAILMFGTPHAANSRPLNLIVGNSISAIIGVTCFYLITGNTLLTTSIAIPLSLITMHFLKCMHPPGGATAVTAIIGGEAIHQLGYIFVIMPIFFNSLILLIIAIAVGSFRDKNPFEKDL